MRLHHIGIASEDIEKSIRNHKILFNLEPITEIEKDPIQKVSVVLLSNSEVTCVPIELIAPLSEDSPVSNILRKGIRLYHICYTVDDIESALKDAKKNGATVISGPSPAKLYNRQRIAFIYTPDGYVVEFLEEKSENLQGQ